MKIHQQTPALLHPKVAARLEALSTPSITVSAVCNPADARRGSARNKCETPATITSPNVSELTWQCLVAAQRNAVERQAPFVRSARAYEVMARG